MGEETFSFSRALHLMRYGNAVVREEDYQNGKYLYVKDGLLIGCNEGEAYELNGEDYYMSGVFIDSEYIMGNWMIYKEEIHGA